jgi:hypothetical protein
MMYFLNKKTIATDILYEPVRNSLDKWKPLRFC